MAREIKVAAKIGGPNPDTNPRLRSAINKALDNNLSRESVEKNIQSSKDASNLEEVIFEGFGENGAAFVIQTLTDNTTRTASNLRGYFSKMGGALSKPGSTKNNFDHLGVFSIDKKFISSEKVLDLLNELQIEDLDEAETNIEISVIPDYFYNVSDIFSKNEVPILSSLIGYFSNNEVNVDAKQIQKTHQFLKSCNDDDDVQEIFHNINLEAMQ